MTDQPLASTTTAQVVAIGTTSESNGVSIVAGNKVTFAYAGTYSLTFSIQITNLANSVEKAIFWLKTNGVDYPDSATEIDLQARKSAGVPNRQVLTINYVATATAGQDVQVYWSGSSTDLSIESLPAGTSPVSPAVPSIILTAVQVMYTQLGPSGATGPSGPSGPSGVNGATGPSGPSGANGADGATGPSGPSGPSGANGANGATGPTGPTGATGPQGVVFQTGTPATTDVLWVDTDDPGDAVIPVGGTIGQALTKNSASDYDTGWSTIASYSAPTLGSTSIASGATVTTIAGLTLTSPALTTPTISTATTNGDLLYGTGSGALTRRAIGTTGQVLTVASGVPSWATPAAGGGMTLISTTSFTGTVLTLSSIVGTYKELRLYVKGLYAANTNTLNITFNGDLTNPGYASLSGGDAMNRGYNLSGSGNNSMNTFTYLNTSANSDSFIVLTIPNYSNTTTMKFMNVTGAVETSSGVYTLGTWTGFWNNTSAITSIEFRGIGTFTAGSVELYGVS
jgi:hypothetical protein